MKKNKSWKDYLWVWSIVYFSLGLFNILFAWLGMIDFIVPLIFALFAGNKRFCNVYCGRGQLFRLFGNKVKYFGNKPTPKWISSKWFRYGFLTFFMTMFINMLYQTYLVFNGVHNVKGMVKLFWTFNVPWYWAYPSTNVPTWVIQYSYGLYSLMLTSAILGIVLMAMYKPRSWCACCPMGTMTQGICKLKHPSK